MKTYYIVYYKDCCWSKFNSMEQFNEYRKKVSYHKVLKIEKHTEESLLEAL